MAVDARTHRVPLSTPTIAAAVRCDHSMIAVRSSGGNGRPGQSGQSGQPRPEPVVRTVEPMAINTIVAMTVTTVRV